MNAKTKKIIGWGLTGLLALVFIGSASMKIMGGDEAVKGAEAMGISLTVLRMIGVVEILSLVLFIIPRSGVLGTLLLAAYLGGAMVAHLLQGQPIIMPMIVQCVLWITAAVRFPELTRRIATGGGAVQPLQG